MSKKSKTGLTRRELLKAAGIGAFGLATNPLWLRNAALAATGGTITWARPTETVLMDPHSSSLGTSWELQHLAYDSLLRMDDNLKIQPSLAEAWEWKSNTLVFTLRSGVKFANGRTMTQNDVVKSLDRCLTAGGSPWGLLLRNKKEIRAAGDNQVEIEFDGSNRIAEYALAATLASILPMKELEAGTYDPKSDKFMGTGPFYVESHTANDRWIFKRNPYYWQKGLPKVDTFVSRTIPTNQGIIAGLRDGSIDIASFSADGDAPALLKGVPNIKVVAQVRSDYSLIKLNALGENSIFADLKVRQAVGYAIDRQQILDFAFGGTGSLTYGFTQFGLLDDSKLEIQSRDIKKAKALIAEAKPATMKTSILYGTELESSSLAAQIIKQNLEEIGFEVKLEGVDQGTWVKRVWGSRPSQFDITPSYFSGFAHPLFTAHWYAPDLAGFTAGYLPVDKDYTALLNEALFAETDQEMMTALQKAYEFINSQCLVIPTFSRVETIAWRTDKISANPSKMQGQNNVMANAETFQVSG